MARKRFVTRSTTKSPKPKVSSKKPQRRVTTKTMRAGDSPGATVTQGFSKPKPRSKRELDAFRWVLYKRSQKK